MKQDPITKLYNGLTDKGRATLAFNYAMQHDEVELCRIKSAMPMQHFTDLPTEYRQRLYNLQNLVLLYAIEYWRLVAYIQTAAAGAMVRLESDDPEDWQPIVQQHKNRIEPRRSGTPGRCCRESEEPDGVVRCLRRGTARQRGRGAHPFATRMVFSLAQLSSGRTFRIFTRR